MKHVLFCRLDNAGDVLLAGPALRAVRAGADRVTLLCGPRGRAAAELLPGVDELLEHRAAWIDADAPPVDAVEITALVEAVRARDVSHALISTSFHQSPLPTALLLRMAGVPVIGALSDDYPGSLLDVRHRVESEIHEVERNLSLAATLGFRLPPGDDGLLRVLEPPIPRVILPERPFVVVHPGSTAPARTATPELFARTAGMLADEGWWVMVTGSEGETDLTSRVAADSARVIDLGGRTTFAELGGIIARASVIITGNSGPAHLAAAVGTPVVQLFPPTVPAARWRPWGVRHRLLGNQEIACAGCRAVHCPVPGQPCLASVTPADVVGSVRSVLADRDFLLPPTVTREVVA